MATNIFPTDNTSEQVKSYWNRPGGKFGTIIGLGILGVIGYKLLPVLTAIVWNTINFGIAVGVGALFLFLVTNRSLRLRVFYIYEIIMKRMAGLIIEMDPFIIAEDYIKDMEKQREIVLENTIKLDAQKEKLVGKIKEKEKEIQKETDRAEAAKQNKLPEQFTNSIRQIERLNTFIKELEPIRSNLEKLGDYLNKLYKNSGYLIEDSKSELELKKDLYYSVTKGNEALNSAMKMFKGDPEKQMLVEQSMEYLKDDMAGKLANMKKAILNSSDIMKTIDLDNAAKEIRGMKMLEEFDPEKSLKLNSSSRNQPIKVEVTSRVGQVDASQYDDIFGK